VEYLSKVLMLGTIDAIVRCAPDLVHPNVGEVRDWVRQTVAMLKECAPLEVERVRLHASFLMNDRHDLRHHCLTEILDTVHRARREVAQHRKGRSVIQASSVLRGDRSTTPHAPSHLTSLQFGPTTVIAVLPATHPPRSAVGGCHASAQVQPLWSARKDLEGY